MEFSQTWNLSLFNPRQHDTSQKICWPAIYPANYPANGSFAIRHEHGQKFALEAEVDIETEKKISTKTGIKFETDIQGSKGTESRLGGVQK